MLFSNKYFKLEKKKRYKIAHSGSGNINELGNVMRLPGSNRDPLEVSGHKLERAPVSIIMSFPSHAQLNRHRISGDLDLNRVLSREYDEGRKRKEIKSRYEGVMSFGP